MRFKIDRASVIVESKFTVFALYYFVNEGNFPGTSPRGGLYLEGRFNGGFYALSVWGAYIWRGLFSELSGILISKATTAHAAHFLKHYRQDSLLHDYHVKFPISRKHAKAIFSLSFLNLVRFPRIQSQGNSPIFDILSALKRIHFYSRFFAAVAFAIITVAKAPSLLLHWTTSSPLFFLRDSKASKTRARVKITPREKGLFSRGVISRALAFRSLYYP